MLKLPSALSGWGDISFDPSVTIPLMTTKQNRGQITADIIPNRRPRYRGYCRRRLRDNSCLNPDQLNALAKHPRPRWETRVQSLFTRRYHQLYQLVWVCSRKA
jgi:hypothetical protein